MLWMRDLYFNYIALSPLLKRSPHRLDRNNYIYLNFMFNETQRCTPPVTLGSIKLFVLHTKI